MNIGALYLKPFKNKKHFHKTCQSESSENLAERKKIHEVIRLRQLEIITLFIVQIVLRVMER